jgi:hypothetical protein
MILLLLLTLPPLSPSPFQGEGEGFEKRGCELLNQSKVEGYLRKKLTRWS